MDSSPGHSRPLPALSSLFSPSFRGAGQPLPAPSG